VVPGAAGVGVTALRSATSEDFAEVAALHADSWRRNYRGAYADSFLDGDVESDRRTVWADRLARPDGTATVGVWDGRGLAGFVHVVFDRDDVWGSLVDNLHVRHDRQRGGLGRSLMAAAAQAVVERGRRGCMYLWVLEQNVRGQAFYRAVGGVGVERALVPPPGGDPSRLQGAPGCLRYAWSADQTMLLSRSA
jgi:ribosomal protein S18 acetylase RimI-like enzyme